MKELHFRREDMQDICNLILDIDVDMTVDTFAVNMIGRNHMKHFLPVQLNQFNSELYLRYDITGMTKLGDRLGDMWKHTEILDFLNGMLEAFEETEAYMLTCDNLYLHEDSIFLDAEYNCRFIFVPIEEGLGGDIISFLHRLVNRMRPDYSEKDTCYFRILNDFNRGAIMKPADLKELLNKNKDGFFHISEETDIMSEELATDIKGEDVHSETVTEVSRREGNSIIKKIGLEIPGIPNVGKTSEVHKDTKKEERVESTKEEKKGSIPVRNLPPPVNMGFEIPGVPDFGKTSEVHKETKKEEKKGKKDNKERFSLFGKKSKPKSDVNIPQQILQEKPVSVKKAKEEEMYESYDETSILNPALQGGEDVTLFLGEMQRAELIRESNKEHFWIDTGVVVGSGSQAGCRIDDNRKISRRHMSIRVENGRYYIKDNNSSNGTYLNGKRLLPETEEELKDNDMIRLANENFIFRIL